MDRKFFNVLSTILDAVTEGVELNKHYANARTSEDLEHLHAAWNAKKAQAEQAAK